MHKTQVCLISGYARDDSPKTKSDKPKVCIFYLSFLAEKSFFRQQNEHEHEHYKRLTF